MQTAIASLGRLPFLSLQTKFNPVLCSPSHTSTMTPTVLPRRGSTGVPQHHHRHQSQQFGI
ncbi:hypothetical protein BDV25DRAFT_149206 [Aspergillus avenaceus]|uniref:Uncharacterized protein n=1 Tax=Aspergillus avenaceus TaxID=36643 RepID=A0A5N6U5G1_ASPAV|nr:hypothetical protein BDV25DRAFT_149206 [Aspergillus avenaceus]